MREADRWARVREVFEAALERPESERLDFANARATTLDFTDTMRRELLGMLSADASATLDSLEQAAPELLVQLGESLGRANFKPEPGHRLGRWTLLRELGRGGMGRVFLAERVEQDFHQLGALKLIESSIALPELQARFREERRILARLEHPGIARLLDGEETPDGQPFLVMEYVDGLPIDRYCNEQRLNLKQRLELMIEVCEIVAAAHRRLVVHRDLKPSNILVDRDGKVRLLDFGIARLIEDDGQAATRSRQFTPEYAAPEQVRGEPATTSVDVHALGLLMYQLLTGTRPWAKTASTPFAYEQAVLNEPPTLPSRALDSELSAPTCQALGQPLDRLRQSLRGDLDAIMMKALRKEPEQRYGSAEALAEDLRHYLARRPVAARRGTRRYQLSRFVGRHRLSVALGLSLLLVLIGGVTVLALQAGQIRAERDQAIAERERADAIVAFQQDIFRQANPSVHGGQEPTASQLLDIGEEMLSDRESLPAATRAALSEDLATSRFALAQYDEAAALAGRALEMYREAGDIAGSWRARILIAKTLFNRQRRDEAAAMIAGLVDGDPHPEAGLMARAEAHYLQGLIVGNEGRTDEALAHLFEAAELHRRHGERVLWNRFRDLSPAITYLGDAGRHEEAGALIEQLQAEVAEAEPDPLMELNLASVITLHLEQSGRHEELRPYLERRLELTEAIYGADSNKASYPLLQLGRLDAEDGEPERALHWLERALAIRTRTMGPEARGTLRVHRSMALVELQMGRAEAARRRIERVIAGRVATHGPDHHAVASARTIHAIATESLGHHLEAAAEARAIQDDLPIGWSELSEGEKERLQGIQSRAWETPEACDRLVADIDQQILSALYRIDCLLRHGQDETARALARSLDADRLARTDPDPALKALCQQALALSDSAVTD
ncbi:serine/threonine-protein kinase [Wenzhouxiangella marina]|uniref:serine/threonine-protein kinase n=1 Tax=Wenzhouxiangella marina TaxID=1579979 RepID=UPI000673906A|nr:serine/threonine-protein kinase [Wenzhouxiangella marina]MBB6087437.1 serine/threonine-protein kinase [Wenzhouxiangella marina]